MEKKKVKTKKTAGKKAKKRGTYGSEVLEKFSSELNRWEEGPLIDPLEDIGLPGQYPYTRGRDPAGFRAFRWPLSS